MRAECLEDRRLLAIVWDNAGTNNFVNTYGTGNAAIATQLISRAIDDWNRVISDFNFNGDGNPQTDNTIH